MLYMQTDRRWKKLQLGEGKTTLGAEGCAVCSLAMWLCANRAYNYTPRELNAILKDAVGGFVNTNWVNWAELKYILPGVIYEGRLDWANTPADLTKLEAYYPCIVYVDYYPGRKGFQQHFLLLKNAQGEALDPMNGVINVVPTYGESLQKALYGAILLRFDRNEKQKLVESCL